MKPKEREALLQALQVRFEANRHRHAGIAWKGVRARLDRDPGVLGALQRMEATGGEPDVIGQEKWPPRFPASQGPLPAEGALFILGRPGDEKASGPFIFCDCSAESPIGRRSTCYDAEAREARKEHKPETSAVEMAAAMGIELLTEALYRDLQELGEFDTRTSSWIATPPEVRALGGALFGDRRYGRVFVYHNGAPSYYAARGFRGALRV
ncbi:DUF4256 domain-containing protein [Ottowia sp.]|uniref:DUF4256 domain-containing protein n=1 Tax=Ottowia sp. TaxID=1898956 RepID=UPI0025CBACEF|nr:DUF4256 domain-containing protein [Ottowia sp.]MBK6615875.1 DUF4256 domain-containing protein [Ottowia sp.]MBK6746925.1 DUF4256 domain-containing protein [Ottowia sp.]